MKFTLLFLALVGVATAFLPPPQCFEKRTKCCFKFHPCGFIVKNVKIVKPCDFKKCVLVCKNIKKRIPKKKCVKKLVKVCHKGHCKFIHKLVCKIHFVHIIVRKCKKVCFRIHALCTQIKKIKFAKFCPKLVCHPPVIVGNSHPPKHVISPKGVVHSIGPVTKKIISKKPW